MPVAKCVVRTTLRPRTSVASRSITAQYSRTQQFSIPHRGSGVGGTIGSGLGAGPGTGLGEVAALAAASDGAFKLFEIFRSASVAMVRILSSQQPGVRPLDRCRAVSASLDLSHARQRRRAGYLLRNSASTSLANVELAGAGKSACIIFNL